MRQKFNILKSHHVTVPKLLHCPFLNSERRLEKEIIQFCCLFSINCTFFRVCSSTVHFYCDDTLFPPKRNGVSKCAIFSAHDWLHLHFVQMVLIRLVLHLHMFNLNKKWHMAGINFEFDNDIHLQN